MPSDLAPRRTALGAPLVLAAGAPGTRGQGGRAAAHDPRVSGVGTPAGGDVVTSDVIIVGAGPAGAATAILLAERGLSVRLLDRARFPRPKICGEYLSPEAPRLLDRLGALKAVDAAASTPHGMQITAPHSTTLAGAYRPLGAGGPH